MTTTAAVFIALIVGAAVAWFLYMFKQNAKTPWVLAFLRFAWFSSTLARQYSIEARWKS